MKIYRFLAVASAAFFIASAQAQNAGTIPNHAVPIGKGPGVTGMSSATGTNNQALMGATGADPTFRALVGADLPTPGASSLGGVQSKSCSSSNWFSSLSTGGVFGCAQPAFTDLTGNIAVSQMNSGSGATSETAWAGSGAWKAPQAFTFTPTNASPAAVTLQQQLQRMPVMCETYSGGCTTANIQQAITDAIAGGRCFQFNGVYNTTTTVSITGGNGNICLTGKGGLKLTTAGSFTAVLELKNFTGSRVDGNISLDCNSNAQIVSALKVWSSGTSVQYQDISFSSYSNCRQAIVIGDRTQSALPLSEIVISRGFFFNVARGVVAYSTNAVVGISNMQNVVDPHSAGSWAISGTATCSGTTVTITVSAGYLDFYDILSGTGFPANTYVVNQTGGTLGGTGTYTVNQACTASSASFTSETRGINVLVSGGFVYTTGGETVNVATNNGYACVNDIMATVYGSCLFTGGAIEVGGSLAATFNPTGVVSPTGGGIQFVNNRGFVGGLTTTDLITGDSTFPGNITVSNNFFFATSVRTGKNITANNSATSIDFDRISFGTNMLQGYAGVSGGTQRMTTKDLGTGVTVTATSSAGPADSLVWFNCAAACVYTLPNPATYPGRTLYFFTSGSNVVTSASANILQLSAVNTNALFPATAGKFLILVSDPQFGNFWRVVAAN